MSVLDLNRDMLVHLLGDPKFFQQCTHFLHMQEQATACYNEYIKNRDSSCEGCGNMSPITPAIAEFVRHCKRLKAQEPSSLECIKDYIGTRRPQRPSVINIKHKFDGTPELLTF